MERDLAPLASLLPAAELTYNEYAPVWGWDISLVRRLHRAGYKDLPTAEQLAEIRRLSSRLTAVELLPAIRRRLPEGSTVGESWTGQTPSGRGANHSPGGEFIVKADYSGSGRGVRVVHGSRFMVQGSWFMVHGSRGSTHPLPASGTPPSLGGETKGFVIEPYYDKVVDFALEFVCSAEEVRFLGISLFETNGRNAYVGNCIAPQQVLWQRISKYVPRFDFEQLINVVREELALRFVGHYLGPLGVDMMIVGDNVHPCVEVNVRRTMGELSLHMLPLLAEGVEGFCRIVFDKDSASLHHTVAAMPPAVCDDKGRLVSGTKLLTPLTADTHYVALIETT